VEYLGRSCSYSIYDVLKLKMDTRDSKSKTTMTTQCSGRLVDDIRAFGLFGNGKNKFHLEIRCQSKSVANTKLCGKCLERPTELGKYHSALLHGLIGEAVPPWSHIFGGEWYRAKVATYGEPDEKEMAKGKAAQAEANNGIDQVIVPVVEKPKKVGETEKPKPKVKRAYKKKLQPAEPQTEAQTQAQESQPKKAKVPTQAVESIETPIDDKEIVKIVVRAFEHDGRQYFIEYNKNKLYSVGKDKRPLAYHGRWDPATQSINVDIHDSDIE
jgi:hypothetical protein